MNRPNRPTMTYHGGKWRLADWIISHFPPHRIYVEPFGGAASVLMKKPRSLGEVYNDLDDAIVNVMRVLQDATLRAQLAEVLSFTPYARAEFKQAREPVADAVEQARRTLIRAQMGFGSAGATQPSTGFRLDVKHHSGGNQRSWARLPQRLQDFGMRLQGVLLENRPALQVLRGHDTPETLFYVDPPYLHAARHLSGAVYRYEMNEADHVELLDAPERMRAVPIRLNAKGQQRTIRRPTRVCKPKGFKVTAPGQCVALDMVERFRDGMRRTVITFKDLYSRFAFAWATNGRASYAAREFFSMARSVFPYPIQHGLSDNGSEFLKDFKAELERLNIQHFHTDPKTPKMNAHGERFNRSIQEEFVDYHENIL